MMNKKMNDRFNALNANGTNTDGMFSFMLKSGTTVTVNVSEFDGSTVMPNANTTIENPTLHRRWVYAQMIRIMERMKREDRNFEQYMNRHFQFTYQLTMMEDEYKVLAAMKRDGDSALGMRALFFNPSAVAWVYRDIANRINAIAKDKASSKKLHKCGGRPYIQIGTEMIYVANIEERLSQMNAAAAEIYHLAQYDDLYREIRKNMIAFRKALPRGINHEGIAMNHDWVEMYKANGSYYSLQNMILFHDGEVMDYDNRHYVWNGRRGAYVGNILKGDAAYEYLNKVAKEHYNEGFYLFGMLKDAVERNGVTLKNLY